MAAGSWSRRRSTALVAALAGFWCVDAVPSRAADAAFGPESCVRGTGAPTVCDYSFPVDDPSRGFVLRVCNGSLEDAAFEPVSSSTIALNGMEVLGPADFSQNVAALEIPVILRNENALRVEVRGKPGGAIGVSILPAVVVDSPREGDVLAVSPLAVRGHLNGSASSVTVNGIAADMSGASFTAAVPLAEGPNTISVAAAREGAPAATDTVSVTLDTVPPAISVVSPVDGATVATPSVDLSGSVDDPAAALTVNGTAVALSGTTFSLAGIALAPGPNTIVIEARDALGNASSTSVSVTYAPPAPTVSLVADPAAVMHGGSSTLSWSSTDAQTASIDQGIGAVSSSGSLAVNPAVTTTYTMTASGAGGTATAQATVTVTSQARGPSIWASPATVHLGETATLTWSADDATGVVINQNVGIVDATGSRAVQPDHTTEYVITAVGPAGVSRASVVVTVLGDVRPRLQGFGARYQDLVPRDATALFEEDRFSVVTGAVTDPGAVPIAGAAVRVQAHPEFGTATTGMDGRYALPVNGGGTLTLNFSKEGFLQSERRVPVPWNDIAVVDPVALTTPDPTVTAMSFAGDPSRTYAHVSSEVTDERGSRSCAVIVGGDNRAYAQVDGVELELASVRMRATEYASPAAMPAKLPPTSAFTYCVELEVEGADDVRFASPVTVYVDNFLGFAPGSVVPVGYYDQRMSAWVPMNNGVVVTLMDRDGDGALDALDADGDGGADDLDRDGDFADDVRGLQGLAGYSPGKSYWRVEVEHFSSLDLNWPWGPPPGAVSPNAAQAPVVVQQATEEVPQYCSAVNSYSDNRSLVFHEDLPLAGTSLSLHYASNRVRGWKHVASIPASGDTVPEALKGIVVEATVAGRNYRHVMPPEPNAAAEFAWDGLDFRGYPVRGMAPLNYRIGFVYETYYWQAWEGRDRAFMEAGSEPTTVAARDELTVWREGSVQVYATGDIGTFGNGWTLSAQHQRFAGAPHLMFAGDGSIRRKTSNVNQLTSSREGYQPAAVDPEGNVFLVPPYDYAGRYPVMKMGRDGVRTAMSISEADGSPAFVWPSDLAIDGEGNLYLAEPSKHRVRVVGRDGRIRTVAGGGGDGGFGGDGGPATSAALNWPSGIDVDEEGNLFIADQWNHRIRKVDRSGRISTVAGDGGTSALPLAPFAGNGLRATEVHLDRPVEVAVDRSGTLFVLYGGYFGQQVLAVDANGGIRVYAGNGQTNGSRGVYGGDGGAAVDAGLCNPYDIALDRYGSLYIADSCSHRIRKVGTDGIINTVGGSGADRPILVNLLEFLERDELGVNTEMHPVALAVDPSGAVYFTDVGRYLASNFYSIRRLNRGVLRGSSGGVFHGAGYSHEFDRDGRHLRTYATVSGRTRYSMLYDDAGYLREIVDAHANGTSFERSSDGRTRRVVAPGGQITELLLDENGDLLAVIYPDGTGYQFGYSAAGLMLWERDPAGNLFAKSFDDNGRLASLSDPEGGEWLYAMSVDRTGVIHGSIASKEGDWRSYREYENAGGSRTYVATGPDGGEDRYTLSAGDVTSTRQLSCGTLTTAQYTLDDATGNRILKHLTQVTPSGLGAEADYLRSYRDADGDGAVDHVENALTVNGRKWTVTDDVVNGLVTRTTPAGRSTTVAYDVATGDVVDVAVAGIEPTHLAYEASGLLSAVTTGSRSVSFAYDDLGHPDLLTTPDGKTHDYSFDVMGRLRGEVRPDGSIAAYEYDGNGNLTMISSPGRTQYRFGFTANDQRREMVQPLSGTYRYAYDRDRRLETVTAPSGETITNQYLAGNLRSTTTPEGTTSYDFLCAGRLGSALRNGERVTLGYDGPLVTGDTRSGTLAASIGYGYDNDFALTSLTYAGAASALGYDSDGLLTSAGGYTIVRNAQNGLPESVSGNGLAQGRIFNGYGELDGVASSVAGGQVYAWSVSERDGAGRILRREESVAGGTILWEYAYYPGGRLREVRRDGQVVEGYAYDDNGNRLSETNLLRGITGKSYGYSVEDHVLSAGSGGYVFDVDGFLQSHTGAEGTTYYQYSSRGELLRVENPDGTILSYVHDPFGRRIAKEVNGTIVEKYLWAGLTTLLAVYDGSDNLLQRYTYADGRVPVSMTAAGATYFLLTDQVGSLRTVADTSGTIVKRIDYDTFGNIISDSNPSFAVPFGFAGGLHDRSTGLVRFGYRDYSPELGRFVAKDPIDFAGGDTNLYAYVMNDPVNLVDSTGLWAEDIHYRKTYAWALSVGFAPGQAERLARADNGTDGGYGSWMPVLGDQSRHFNQGGGSCDSRSAWAEREFQRAVGYYKAGNIDAGLGHLGRGLHSLQDIDPHRDWDTGASGTGRHPDWYDSWGDTRNVAARAGTEQKTLEYLRRFISAVSGLR